MIIKVGGTDDSNNSWRFHEAHEVQWSECTYKELREEVKMLEEGGVVRCEFFFTCDENEMLDTYILARICFLDQDMEPRHIYTMTTTYLLNNEGKTVDKIN